MSGREARLSRKRHALSGLAFVSLLAALLAGCTTAPPKLDKPESSPPAGSDSSAAESWDQIMADYHSTFEDLVLPNGAQLVDPVKPPPDTLPDGTVADGVYEQGYGKMMAEMAWYCAWEGEWLDARGKDTSREDAALQTMLSFPDTFAFKKTYDAGLQELTKKNLTNASVGDPTGIARDWELNCAHS